MNDGVSIRPLDAASEADIELVAQRMRLTLIEVEGELAGGSMYSMDWLRERVRFHLDPSRCRGQVLLAVPAGRHAVAGHCIVRMEPGGPGASPEIGLFSTTYVDPSWRRHGIADALLRAGEGWLVAQGASELCTWTSATNLPLIHLYARHGYTEAERGRHEGTGTMMVRLARRTDGAGATAPRAAR